MPKKETKKDRQAALRQQQHTAPFSAPNDPPIIVSGGSVTITSKFELTASKSPDGKYVYTTDKVKVKKIKTKGKKDQEDDSNNGQFTIELWD